jgi:hypothetical protein
MRSALVFACLLLPLQAQLNSLSNVLTVTPPEKLIVKRGQDVSADFVIQLRSGYHVNSSTPADEYLIPLKLTLTSPSVEVHGVDYPKPQLQKFAFSEKPVSVYEGEFKTQVKFKVPTSAPTGLTEVPGKLRYQACNDRMCLPPRTVDLKLPLDIRN